ncbi:MAG: TadE family protein, partial [Ktedonobacterales bacterium]
MSYLRRVLRGLARSRSSGIGRSGRGRPKSRGQALVEFALFVPLLMLLVIGATDVSTLLDDHLDVVYA